jgi:hypothetical protein
MKDCPDYSFDFFGVLCDFFVGLMASLWNWLTQLIPTPVEG